MTLKPLKNKIFFQFLYDSAGWKFITKTQSGILLTNQDYQANAYNHRWGTITHMGPDVREDLNVGDYILIESLQWSTSTVIDDAKYWMTDDTKIIATSKEEIQIV